MKDLNILATDMAMSLAELKEDNLFSKINEEFISNYLGKSMNIGIMAAENLRSQYKDNNIREICRDKGIKINLIEGSQKLKFVRIRAEYFHHKRQLNIYVNSIRNMKEQFQSLDMGIDIEKLNIIDIHIAHELFHFLEYEEIGLTNERLESVDISNVFNKKRVSTVLKTREIAAHMFCKKILNLDIHPKWMDYLYLLGVKEITYKELKQYLINLNEEVTKLIV